MGPSLAVLNWTHKITAQCQKIAEIRATLVKGVLLRLDEKIRIKVCFQIDHVLFKKNKKTFFQA